MNQRHAELCSSAEWASHLRDEVVLPLTASLQLGEKMLEIGPGPGAATEVLRGLVKALTVVELDEEAAKRLRTRLSGSDVEVVTGDASATGFPDDSFDSVGSFTMLHHVPTAPLQNEIFAEVLRLLRPGGLFVGSDSLASNELHGFHEDDTYNPIEPSTMLTRLFTIGFEKVTVSVEYDMRFVAYKPKP